MIKEIELTNIEECVAVIRKSFATVAEEFGFVHGGTEKYDFFPFTCGYMKKEL